MLTTYYVAIPIDVCNASEYDKKDIHKDFIFNLCAVFVGKAFFLNQAHAV
jgi:hypothetical protein